MDDTDEKVFAYRLEAVEKAIVSIQGCLDKLTEVVSDMALQKKDISILKEDVKALKDGSRKWSDRILDVMLTALVSGLVGAFVVYILKR